MRVRTMRRAVLVLAAMVAAFASLASTASAADYHDMVARAHVAPSGVDFYVVPRLDAGLNLIYAEGTVDATGTGLGGRINFVSLDERNAKIPEAQFVNVRNTPSNQTMATNGKLVWGTATWPCSPGFQYRARLQYHIDGTATTASISVTTPATNC
jgi:hypothetical protein